MLFHDENHMVFPACDLLQNKGLLDYSSNRVEIFPTGFNGT